MHLILFYSHTSWEYTVLYNHINTQAMGGKNLIQTEKNKQ